MTTKTGATEMALDTRGPPFIAAIGGACVQLGTLGYVWRSYSSAATCMASPLRCLGNPAEADTWGLTVVLFVPYVVLQWALSLRTVRSAGTSDPSIVDRLWSIMPWIYVWGWYLVTRIRTGNAPLRLLVMAAVSSLWGLRLTYNFVIKGGYSGGEDYRWAVVRKWYPSWRWEVFNFIFVCSFQQYTILAFAVPAVTAMQSSVPFGALDVVATALYLLLLLGETVADYQMWVFQSEKYRRKSAGEALGPYARGFVETGLWAYSRHPNYFCEVSIWWAFYLFSVAATGRWMNWTIWGALFLTSLFVPPGASLDVTEKLSSSKYPAYAEYQKVVSRFVPWLPRKDVSVTKSKSQ